MARLCSRCRLDLPELEFSIRKDRGTFSSQCKGCHKQTVRESYLRHRSSKLQAQGARNKQLKVEGREFVRHLKSSTPCTDCSQHFHWAAMQFDHVRGIKYRCVAELVSHGCSIRILQREIDKCEIVCANCHAIRTYRRLGLD